MAPTLVDRNAEFTIAMAGRGKRTGTSATRTSRNAAPAASTGARGVAPTRTRNRGGLSNVESSPASRTRLKLKTAQPSSSQQPAPKAAGGDDLTGAMESAAEVAHEESTTTPARTAVGKAASSKVMPTVEEELDEEAATGEEAQASGEHAGERSSRNECPWERNAHVRTLECAN